MTIVVTPDALSAPPKVIIDLDVPVGSVMSTVSVWRNDSNGKSLLRTQPAAGFDSQSVTDYECPYGEAVTYEWAADYTTGFSTIFSEAWASLAAWTVGSGSWNVSGGKARNTGATINGLARTFAAAKARVTIASFTEAVSAGSMGLGISDGVYNGVVLQLNPSGTLTVLSQVLGVTVGAVLTTIDTTQPITVDFNATSITVTGTGGSATIALDVTPSRVALGTNGVAANGMSVGAIEVKAYGAPASIAETSDPIILDSIDAWLIHPGAPLKSFDLSNTDHDAAGIKSLGDVTNPTNATLHQIMGSSTPVTTTTGPRGDDVTSMIVYLPDANNRAALRALLRDDIPILIQIPPSWGFDFECGFYAVGTVIWGRIAQNPHGGALNRDVNLPLTKTTSPAVDVDDTGWSWAQLAAEFPTWDDVKANFATWADVAANNRS